MPVGPSILWPVKRDEVGAQACTSVAQVGHVLARVDEHERAGGVGGVGEAARRR